MSVALAIPPLAGSRIVNVPPAAFNAAMSAGDGSLLNALTPTHDPAYGRLPEKAKSKFLVKLGAMVTLDQARNKTAIAALLADQLGPQVGRGFSAVRLLNDYYAWIGACRDWRLLVDAALAPEFRASKRTCGLVAPKIGDGCQVPPETADWWITTAERYQRNSAAGWREVKRLWTESWGDSRIRVPGYGSARAYWSKVKPSLLLQPTCPPDLPRGWSRSTFYEKMPPEWETAIKRVGSQYAAGLLPGIPGTRKGARYLEYVFLDDKWHDLEVVVDGIQTPCRLLEIGAVDYATGEYICWGFRPELPGATADDARERLKERDVKWLVAAMFQQEGGYPRDYDCHIICERGTTVLREGPARALFDLSGGRIKVCYTGMEGGLVLTWNEQQKGNSRGKAPIESLHNYLKNESAALAGQTGVDHARQPAVLNAQLKEARDLQALALLAAPEIAGQLQGSLLRQAEAVEALEAIYRRANERPDHELEGISKDVVEVRVGLGRPWETREQLDPAELRALMQLPGFEARTRKPSPLELKKRLRAQAVFVPVPEWAWPQFYDHTQIVKAIEGLEITFKREGKDYIFWPDDNDPGALTAAKEMERRGERLCGYFDDRNPERLYLTRENGAFFATWRRVHRASRADRQAHSELQGRKARRAAFARRGILRRHGAEEQRQMAVNFANGRLLEQAGVLPVPTAPTLPASPDSAPAADLALAIGADRQHRESKAAATRRKPRLTTDDFMPVSQPAATHPGSQNEAPAACNDEGFTRAPESDPEPKPTRRRILDAADFF